MMTAEDIRPLVLSIHGITTRGAWQKDLTRVLHDQGFNYDPLDYGWFYKWQLLIPRLRSKQIEWFRDEYTSRRNGGPPPSIIAHSFGSYLVARSMQKYPEIVFDRIILCGSIVQKEFPWPDMIKAGRCTAILNDYGHLDWASWVAVFVIEDAGRSGVEGFTHGDRGFVQRYHPEFGHSDYFYKLNYEKNWAPFLAGKEMTALSSAPNTTQVRNRRFWLFVTALFLLGLGALGGLGYWIWLWYQPKPPQLAKVSIEQFLREFEDAKARKDLDSLRKAYVRKTVEWKATIRKFQDDQKHPAYFIAPSVNTPWEQTIFARLKQGNSSPKWQEGDRVFVSGEISEITPRGAILEDSAITELAEE